MPTRTWRISRAIEPVVKPDHPSGRRPDKIRDQTRDGRELRPEPTCLRRQKAPLRYRPVTAPLVSRLRFEFRVVLHDDLRTKSLIPQDVVGVNEFFTKYCMFAKIRQIVWLRDCLRVSLESCYFRTQLSVRAILVGRAIADCLRDPGRNLIAGSGMTGELADFDGRSGWR